LASVSKLRDLLAKYGYSLKDVISLLDSQAGRRAPATEQKAGSRKPRQVKAYKNPNSGEVVETKGGNHKTLKEWKAEYGSDTVESWLTSDFVLSTNRGPFCLSQFGDVAPKFSIMFHEEAALW
jgi:hypothetical protein